jgi:DNA-binding NarL/FixJ family response regulator
MRSVRVVLADNQPVVRSGLRALLSAERGITVVAEATTRRELTREVVLARPEVVILDLEQAQFGGVTVIEELVRATPSVAVLVFSRFDDIGTVLAALRAGARGCLGKDAEPGEIVPAVRGLAAGQLIFGAPIVPRMTELLADHHSGTAVALWKLTGRERQVLDLVAAGLPNAAIAHRLGLAPKTVSNHMSAIFAKLRVADRAAVVSRARGIGLGQAIA